jgi:hypothetical protein
MLYLLNLNGPRWKWKAVKKRGHVKWKKKGTCKMEMVVAACRILASYWGRVQFSSSADLPRDAKNIPLWHLRQRP